MAACKWCKRPVRNMSKIDGVCDYCMTQFLIKKDFVSKNKDMPEDDTPEEELWALMNLNTTEGQRIMDQRIKRVSKEIQTTWSTHQSEERAVQKKSKRSVSLSPALWVARREASNSSLSE